MNQFNVLYNLIAGTVKLSLFIAFREEYFSVNASKGIQQNTESKYSINKRKQTQTST